MLNILEKPVRHCDGIPRRVAMQIGTASLGALTLPNLLRAEAASQLEGSRKGVINVHLDGGPPQMDMIDMKPDGPAEVRGEFRAIATSLPGFQICELMPRTAAIANKFAFVRSLVGSIGKHHAFQTQSGFDEKELAGIGGRPAFGCAINRLTKDASTDVPAYVDLMQGRGLVRNSTRPGFLGPAFAPFRPDLSKQFQRELEAGMKGELKRLGSEHAVSLELMPGLNMNRLEDRHDLLHRLDTMRRNLDAGGSMEAVDRFTQQAIGILTSGRFAEAFEWEKEDTATLKLYTPDDLGGAPNVTSEGPEAAKKLLLARRLVEAGVRVVSVSISDFDTHQKNFPRLRHLLPIVDTAIAGLITDLDQRGMLEDVSVVIWGEFGRTPKINSKGGRDHWPRVSPAILAGGKMNVGQVIGGTDRWAGEATSQPVTFEDVIATLYHNLGINPHQTTITDSRGRPQYLVDRGQPIKELVG
ncbi:MAG: DUF1501 domain-containing protein [Pirellulaceae bacterium]